MEKCENESCKMAVKVGETCENRAEMKEQDFTEALHGIISLRKGKSEEKDVWFGTVGNQLVSDGAYDTKKDLIENLENVTLERVCKIVAGAFERAITYKENKK